MELKSVIESKLAENERELASLREQAKERDLRMQTLMIENGALRNVLTTTVAASVTTTTTQSTSTTTPVTTTLPMPVRRDPPTVTEAVLQFISEHGDARGVFVPDILRGLNETGFTSKAVDKYALVYTVCKKLIRQKRIAETRRDGKRAFVKKEI